jgi:hypothetical protein
LSNYYLIYIEFNKEEIKEPIGGTFICVVNISVMVEEGDDEDAHVADVDGAADVDGDTVMDT